MYSSTRTYLAISVLRLASKDSLLSPLHGGNTLIPSLDHLADAESEFERRAAID